MFDVAKIKAGLKGQVGWQQPYDPVYAIVDTANQQASSALFFTDNQFVKIPFIRANQDYANISDLQFNQVLTRIEDQAIVQVCNQVFDRPDYIDRQVLFPYANNKVNTDPLPAGFVGYKIIPDLQKNLAFEITRCALEFQGTGDITLLLYNSAIQQPIRTQSVSITGPFQIIDLNWKMDNTEGFYKGEYYFGYNTEGVTVIPFEREYEFSEIKSKVTGLYIENVNVPFEGGSTDLFDLEDYEESEETWGLNPDISVFEDYTDQVLSNKRLFSTAIQMQGQIIAMSIYVASLRSNEKEALSADMVKKILLELDGAKTDSWSKKGLRSALNSEVTRVKEELIKLKDGLFSDHDIISVTRS